MPQPTSTKKRKPRADSKQRRRQLVQTTATKLRGIILEREPGAQIGSLTEVAEGLGVGIVTVQQAARILEHEGLLEVRRGPGGGYYGTRPDEAALERSLAAFLRVHGSSFEETLEITSLLICEIIPAAARCRDQKLREEMQALEERIDDCATENARIAFESDLNSLLLKMNARPLFELLLGVGMQLFNTSPVPLLYPGDEGVAAWKAEKHRMLEAILKGDEALARFEAGRYRADLLSRLKKVKR